jgi:CelD/BcsL family acetyltransferase involved in cellulose biosynthesis
MIAEWIRDEPTLEHLVESWRDLAETAHAPYALPDWMLAWWRNAAPSGSEIRVLVLRDRGSIAGIGPFFVDRRFGLRRLRVLGAGVSSAPTVIARDGAYEALARAVLESFADRSLADVLLLEGVPEADPWFVQMRVGVPGARSLARVQGWTQASPGLSLEPIGYDEWFGQKGSKFRSRIRRGERQLAALGGRHSLATSRKEIQLALEQFESLHDRRWQDRGGSGVLSHGVRAMIREFADRSPQNLRVWTTEAEGRPLSVQVYLVAGGTVCHWLGGLDDRETALHPGAGVLGLHRAIEHAWESGDRYFDFGAGEQAHKYRFADTESVLEYGALVRTRRHTVAAMLPGLPVVTRAFAARHLAPRTKRRLRKLGSALPWGRS